MRSYILNCTLAQFGQDQVDAPPPAPEFPALGPQNLAITNIDGAIALNPPLPTRAGVFPGACPPFLQALMPRESLHKYRHSGVYWVKL